MKEQLRFERQGFLVTPGVLDETDWQQLREAVTAHVDANKLDALRHRYVRVWERGFGIRGCQRAQSHGRLRLRVWRQTAGCFAPQVTGWEYFEVGGFRSPVAGTQFLAAKLDPLRNRLPGSYAP